MTNFDRGDVVIVDLGMIQKTRPCVVVASSPDPERAMSVVIPMTTQIRGGKFEIPFPKPSWLNEQCVLNLVGIAGVDNRKIVRRIGPFPDMKSVDAGLRKLLSL